MSLIVVVYVPGGIVMAGDSRTMTGIKVKLGKDKVEQEYKTLSDNSNKVVALNKAPVGIGHTGTAVINNQPVESHIKRFEEEEVREGDTPAEIAEAISTYFQKNFAKVPVEFCVAGYEIADGVSTPYVYILHTTGRPKPLRINEKDGKTQYGILRLGDTEIINRLIKQEFLPPFGGLPLQDAIEYAIYLIDLTIKTMRFEPKVATVGGPIDVLLITPDGLGFVQQKQLHGEDPSQVWQPRPATTSAPAQAAPRTKKRAGAKKK